MIKIDSYFTTIFVSLCVASSFFFSATQAAEKAKHVPEISLTEAGDKLADHYVEVLKDLNAQLKAAAPVVNEQQKDALQKACDAVKKATDDLNSAQQSVDKIKTAKALVEHAKGKWIGGAEKGITEAEAALKKATTDAEREKAQKELAKWQANKEDGIKALKERQDALNKAMADEAVASQANQKAKEQLAQARAIELNAAKALLADVESFLSNEKLDSILVKCALLSEATPKGLAEFAQQSNDNHTLVEDLLSNTALMKQMMEEGGASDGKYGQAAKIYSDIQNSSPRAKEGMFQRLALATSLELAVPQILRKGESDNATATTIDPVKRYLHFEKAFLNGELDPAFKTMTVWEYRMIVNCDAPDDEMEWGRAMLRNYRPDHIYNPNYGWRYSGAVRTDVPYRHSNEYKDSDNLDFFQNVIKNGGICGRRAFFGRFIVQSFGLPVWGVTQHAHAALGRWTPTGWVVNLGANWEFSWYRGRSGPDFLLETQTRKYPDEFAKVLRAQWMGTSLGEKKYDSMKNKVTSFSNTGLWNLLAQYKQKVIIDDKKPSEHAALGQEIAEANETTDAKSMAVVNTTTKDEDKKITTASNGVITIPAAACSGAQVMSSFGGGYQLFCGGKTFTCAVEIPSEGRYALSAHAVTVHDELQVQISVDEKNIATMTIPYTCGMWQATKPIELSLHKGSNTLSFSKPSNIFSLKDFKLTPIK